jgi:hypothetical protein
MPWASLMLLVKLRLLHQKKTNFGELGKIPEHSRNRQCLLGWGWRSHKNTHIGSLAHGE